MKCLYAEAILCKFKSEHELLNTRLQPNFYLLLSVCVYFAFLNSVTNQIKRSLRFYNISKLTLI